MGEKLLTLSWIWLITEMKKVAKKKLMKGVRLIISKEYHDYILNKSG